jgi:hypothetical protein
MTEQNSKLRLKLGSVEVEYEGRISDLNQELPELLETISSYVAVAGKQAAKEQVSSEAAMVEEPSNSNIDLSTNTIAMRSGASTCGDLALAAATNLYFVQKKDKFSYKDILAEMQRATSFYKTSMNGSNLKNALGRLVKDKKINECGGGVYALHASALPELKARLAAA